jgi:predicted  nucleic acid-binding Zn-ribbon protein
MIMAESTTTTASSDGRLVTVADLRYEFDRERRITDAHFANILTLIELLNQRLGAVGNQFDNVDRRFEELDKKFDQRFEHIDKKFEQRIDHLENKLDQRFCVLEERLRFNKTLVVASLSAFASISSVIVTLLK